MDGGATLGACALLAATLVTAAAVLWPRKSDTSGTPSFAEPGALASVPRLTDSE